MANEKPTVWAAVAVVAVAVVSLFVGYGLNDNVEVVEVPTEVVVTQEKIVEVEVPATAGEATVAADAEKDYADQCVDLATAILDNRRFENDLVDELGIDREDIDEIKVRDDDADFSVSDRRNEDCEVDLELAVDYDRDERDICDVSFDIEDGEVADWEISC